ncbi:hypothetical protein AB1Y20_005691 [Prymnesium parvum]|uniref:Uncharacterized protein n=1 Tax=Prymnesium parvum TaxID=97485 RepID=A0AB34J025_PRYPA
MELSWGKVVLQPPPRPGFIPPPAPRTAHASELPLVRSHRRPVSRTPAGRAAVPYGVGGKLETDHIAEYKPLPGTQARRREEGAFNAMGTTVGWAPHQPNRPGSTRAVYNPVSHETALYTFTTAGGVERVNARGDQLLREKAARDREDGSWYGRRKGVVEFVDRTHFYAVNANEQFLRTCNQNEHAFHPQKGALSHWMDAALRDKS